MAKNDYGYMARIGVDTSGLDEALRDSQRELKNAEDGIKRLDKVISDTEKNGGDSTELLAKREAAYGQYARIAAEHLTGLAEKQKYVEEAFKTGQITAGEYATYISQLAQATERYNKTQEELNPALSGNIYDDLRIKLEGVNKAYSDSIKELAEVNNALKQSGDSETLFSQKTELLGNAIFETEKKLTVLLNVQNSMTNAFNNGDIPAEKYRAYQREVETTESTLKGLRQELEETKQAHNGIAEAVDNAKEKTISFNDILKANIISDLTIKGIEKLTDAFKQLGEEIKNIAVGTAAYGDTVDKQSQRLGMTRDAYQEWNYILSQNGANISTLTAGMRTLTNQIDSAGNGGKAAAANFEKLGLSVNELQGLTGEQQFSKVVTALQEMENETERNAVANDVLGRSYQQLIPLLNQDSDSVEKLRQRAHDTNQILSDDGVNAAVNYTDAMDTLTRSIEGFKHQLGEQVLPILTEFIDTIIEAINDTDEEQIQDMLSKIAEGAEELADIIRDFISDGGIEKILDFFEWIIDHGEEAVNVLKLLACAWGVSKVAAFCGEIGKIPGLIGKITSSIAGLPGQVSNVGTSFGNMGTSISDTMSRTVSVVTGAETTVTVSLGAIAAAAAAAVAAIASAIAIADELNTIAEGMTNESAGSKKSKANISTISEQWENLENMEGLERYNAAIDFKDDILEREEDWNKRYKAVVDELGELEGKTFKTASETARMKELQATQESLDAEWAMLEAFGAKVDNELAHYSSESIRGMEIAAEAQNQSMANAGRTTEAALADVWDGIRRRTEEKMKELDDLLATHQITEEAYWSQRKEWLEAHRDEESAQWWEYYDDVTGYYEKAAQTEKDAAQKAIDDTEKALTDRTRKTMENLKRVQQEQGLSDKWLMEQYKLLSDSLEKGTDAYYAAYDAYLDMRDKVRDENEKQAEEDRKQREQQLEDEKKDFEKRLDEMKKQHDEEVKLKKKEAEDNLSLLRETQEEYSKSASEMSERVTDDKGKERLVLQDYNEESKKLQKYRSSMDKLKSLGLSEELLASVDSFSYEDGSRQMYIDELLRMRPEKRKQYEQEYLKYIDEQKKTAEYDTGLNFDNEQKSLTDAANGLLDEPAEQAYQLGIKAGENYVKGLESVLESSGITGSVIESVTMKNPAAAQTNKNGSTPVTGNEENISGNTSAGMQGISPGTVIAVNIAGTSVIRMTLEELLRENILMGGNNLYA